MISYSVTLCSIRRASFALTKVPVSPAKIFSVTIRSITSFTLTGSIGLIGLSPIKVYENNIGYVLKEKVHEKMNKTISAS